MDLVGVERRLSMPRMYFYSKLGSDRDWIKARMYFIPEDKKHEVSKEYEKRFLSGKTKTLGRKNANTWLNGLAKEYRYGS